MIDRLILDLVLGSISLIRTTDRKVRLATPMKRQWLTTLADPSMTHTTSFSVSSLNRTQWGMRRMAGATRTDMVVDKRTYVQTILSVVICMSQINLMLPSLSVRWRCRIDNCTFHWHSLSQVVWRCVSRRIVALCSGWFLQLLIWIVFIHCKWTNIYFSG